MPDWKRLKDRLWLWLAGLAASALVVAALTLFDFPAFQYLPLLALLWLPIVVHLLAKTDTPVNKEWAYCLHLVLVLRVAGPSLTSQGIVGWVKSWGTDFSSVAIFDTIALTVLLVWQSRRGSGAQRRLKDNENKLNIGEKYA